VVLTAIDDNESTSYINAVHISVSKRNETALKIRSHIALFLPLVLKHLSLPKGVEAGVVFGILEFFRDLSGN